MPCEHEIDPALRLVRFRAWGVLTHAELAANRIRMVSDPAFRSDLDQLADFRETTSLDLSPAEVREFASHSYFGAGSRRALVIPDPASYGLGRMFETYRVGYVSFSSRVTVGHGTPVPKNVSRHLHESMEGAIS